VVSCKYLYLSASLEHNIDEAVEIFRFLGLLAYLGKDSIPTNTLPHLELLLILSFLAFISHQADLIRVHEVVPVGQIDLFVFEFDPD
jgi:hypothetical protein